MNSICYESSTESAPFSKSALDQFARQMRVDMSDFKFDDDYLQFIAVQNGGKPTEKHFDIGEGNWFTIDRFLNFSDTSVASQSDLLFHVHHNWNDIEDRLHSGMFPFAVLGGGDYLLFSQASGHRPEVVIWFHEKSSEDSPAVQFLAKDFASFVGLLRPQAG